MTSRRAKASLSRSILLVPLLAGGLLASTASLRAETTSTASENLNAFDTTRTLIGSYLAGRFAKAERDGKEAAEFYRNALQHDPENELLLEQAFQTELGNGNWPRTVDLARSLIKTQPQNRLAQLTLALEAFKQNELKSATEHFTAAGGGPIGELTSALAIAWINAAEGNTQAAIAKLDLPKQADWAQFFLRYHQALIADIGGKKQEARASYERVLKLETKTLRTTLAYARSAAAAGDRKLALNIVKAQLEKSPGDGHPLLRSLKANLEANRKVPLIFTTPEAGMAEVFYGLGEALISEGAVGVGILYLQMALHAAPDHQFALAALANAYEASKDYADALATYERIPVTSPLATAVQIRKAFNLNALERGDEAREVLTGLLDGKLDAPAAPASALEASKAAEVSAESSVTLEEGEVLKLKSKGPLVQKLQEALSAKGYNVTPDGSFGDGTRKAVLAFQAKSRMKRDGLVGPDTLAAILGEGGDATPKPSSMSAAKSASSGASSEAAVDTRLPLTLNDRLEILDAIGNILRAKKQFAEAIPYYDKALALIEKPQKQHWIYYYARGTSYERIKNWTAAEADLKKALELYPDQPLILNYLGYSWVDQGLNLKEGMAYIEKAVSLKPDDGYIVDSLGWAHYRQGNYRDAVRYLERAVELRADDPVLNDHLGDALWRVGREREARFQWEQALSLKPEPEDAEKIKTKLEKGLEAVEKTKAAGNQTEPQPAEALPR